MRKAPKHQAPSKVVVARSVQLYAVAGSKVRDERIRRRWTLRQLAARAGLSVAMAQMIESGVAGSVETYVRLAVALGIRFEMDFVDPSIRSPQAMREVDFVHSAMGEFEAAHFRGLGFPTGLDEPYQHYQFAGRADVIAWDIEKRALLHLENRTRNPDFQAAAGAYNGKRAYLGDALAARLGIPSWRSETHAIAALWSAEMLHAIRLRPESFRSLCPDPADAFGSWWEGASPTSGRTSALIVIDPTSEGKRREWIDFEGALSARPRGAGYATFAEKLQR